MDTAQESSNEGSPLRELAQGFAIPAIGEPFFRTLAQLLARTLAVDYAFIGELTQQGQSVRSVAFFAKGRLADPLEYPLAGSLCQHVVKPAFCAFPSGVQQLFPDNRALRRFGVDSYLGTPLVDGAGRVRGLIYVMHSGPLTNVEQAQDLLSIVARRTELEMERHQQEEKLRQANRLLQEQNQSLQALNQQLGQVQQSLLAHQEGLQTQVASRTRQLTRSQLLLRRTLVRTLLLNQRLRERERELQLLTDALPVLISYLDAGQRYRLANRPHQQWFGRPPGELLGRTVREVAGEADHRSLEPYLQGALSGQEQHFESELDYPAVGRRLVEVHYVPHREQGEVRGCYALITDISERKRAQEQLLTRNRQLSQTNEDLDNFVYAASHDLKGPIANIEGLVDLLSRQLGRKGWQDEVTRESIRQMEASVRRFRGTLSDLTEVARLQRGQEARQAVSLPAVVAEVLEDLQPSIRASGVRIDQRLEACGEFSYAPQQLKRVVYNLLSNAIKYRSLTRQLVVEVSCRQTGQHLIFSVRDNGLGMDMRDRAKIFGLFKRLHTHVEGTGIGLYIVKKIVEGQGGRIEVESQPGLGSLFRVYILKQVPATQLSQ